MNIRRAVVILLPLVAMAFQASEKAPQIDSIRKEQLRADLFYLASDGMQGRMTGTPTNSLAAEYIRSRFEHIGLKPAATAGSYFQAYNLMTAALGGENLLEIREAEALQLRMRSGQDFYPLRFSASGRCRGTLVFAGFGIAAPSLDYDDYRNADIKGKIVLVLDHEPGERNLDSPFAGVVSSEYSNQLRKALFAQERGAIGILFVEDVHNHPGPRNFEAVAQSYWPQKPTRFGRYTLAAWMEKVRIPAVQISPALADILLHSTGRKLTDLSRASETATGAAPLVITGVEMQLSTSLQRQVLPDRNVVGLFEGADPNLKNEWLILCAHYDHNGMDGDRAFPGADDDASGIVALFEIAEAYARAAQAGQKPRRSVLFAAWNSEELGLLGAWAYVEDPLWLLDKTVAVLNLDMIGRNEEVPEGGGARFRGLELQTAESNSNAINVLGTSRSPDIKMEVEKANRGIGLELKFRYDNNSSNLMRRSDHWPFLNAGVPALWFLTGLHPDYHTIYDRPEKVNYLKMEKIARMVYQMSWNLAQQDTRPAFKGPKL